MRKDRRSTFDARAGISGKVWNTSSFLSDVFMAVLLEA
jgi:hypothetical protein